MRLAGFFWLLLVAAASLYLAVRLHQGIEFQTDLLALLPQEERDANVQQAKDRITQLLGQRIVLLIGDKDRTVARSAGVEMAKTLQDSGVASSVIYSLQTDSLKRLGEMYFPYRFGLLTPGDRALLENNKGAEIAARALANMYGPVGMADGKLLRRDPFLLLPTFLTALPPPLPRLAPDEGVLSVEDGGLTYVLIVAQLSGDPYALAFQDRFTQVFDTAEKSLLAKAPDLAVLRLGAVFYAQSGAKAAISETSAISIVSFVGTVLLVLLVFRALRPLWLTLLAIGVGIVCAFAFCLWWFGTLHVIALLFGTSLIGIALDYCLQYLTTRFERETSTPRQRLRRVLPAISLGLATTMIGYITLLFAPFPGLRQVALFSAVGLAASFATVLLWLPALDRAAPLPNGRGLLNAANWLWLFWEQPRYRWPRIAVIALCLALTGIGAMRFTVDDDVHRLQALSPTLTRQEAEVRRLTGIAGGSEFLLVRAADDEHALQAEEALVDRLDQAKQDGAVGGFQALAQIIPSVARQIADRALVHDRLLTPYLAEFYQKLGLTERSLSDEGATGFLTPAAIAPDSPFAFMRNFVIDGGTHLVLLNGVVNRDRIQAIADAIPGVRLIDPALDITRLLGDYRRRAMLLIAISALLMVPVLIWRYGVGGSGRVLLPPAIALLLTPPLAALTGVPFTFFSAMALVLVLSIGFDYAVFCKETEPRRRSVTMLGVWLAMVTTLLSFGLLGFSRVFAVHAFGVTLLIGTILAFLVSPLAGGTAAKSARVERQN